VDWSGHFLVKNPLDGFGQGETPGTKVHTPGISNQIEVLGSGHELAATAEKSPSAAGRNFL
jgi:hypothetical protein